MSGTAGAVGVFPGDRDDQQRWGCPYRVREARQAKKEMVEANLRHPQIGLNRGVDGLDRVLSTALHQADIAFLD